MGAEKHIFKPTASVVAMLIILCLLFVASIFFAIRENWIVLLLCIVTFLVVLPDEIRSLSEQILICDDYIRLQNVDCVMGEKEITINRIDISWKDIKTITLHTSSLGTPLLVIKTKSKFKNSSTYIKSLESYFLFSYDNQIKKMKTIIHQYRKDNKKRKNCLKE